MNISDPVQQKVSKSCYLMVIHMNRICVLCTKVNDFNLNHESTYMFPAGVQSLFNL